MDDVGTQPRKSAERCKAGCRIGGFLTNDHQLPWIVGGPAVTAPPAALPSQCPEAARQIPENLCARQRPAPRPVGHPQRGRTTGASGRRHELGRFRAGEPAGRGSGHVRAAFYRTAAGAEIDLVLELGGYAGIWAVEVKKNSAPKLESGFHSALEDLQPDHAFVVYTGSDRYLKSQNVTVLSLRELAQELARLDTGTV